MSHEQILQQMRQQAQGALSLNIAFIGVTQELFETLARLEQASVTELAKQSSRDPGYLKRWCDAAFAFGYLEQQNQKFSLTELGHLMRPSHPQTLMSMAIQSVLSAHMAERAASLMSMGERPGESVLAERPTILPWFGAMIESGFARLFEDMIIPGVPAFADVDQRGGLAVDLGCGNGWYLRALAKRCSHLRGLGIDGFAANIQQAEEHTRQAGLQDRVSFRTGDLLQLRLDEPADLMAMNRALHHVWEQGLDHLLPWMKHNLKPGGYIVIWEPAWPTDPLALGQPQYRTMAFQNLSEHVQGNHFLQPEEIRNAFESAGLPAQTYLFQNGLECITVARKPPTA